MIRRCSSRPRAALALLAALAGAVVGLTGCGGASSPRAPAYGSGAGAPTLAQVTSLLDRHARAVLSHASAGFLADVDTAAPAATFRQQQAGEIAALAAVPLRLWQYTVSSPVTDLATVRAAAKQYGAPTTVVHLTLSYALNPVDAAPVTHDLWWTFVQRHGHVFAAGDSTMAGLGGQSWHGPWDFGPIVVHRGASSLVLAHPASAGTIAAISADVDAAVDAVTGVWGADWARQVAVIVPASAAEFAALGASTNPGGAGTTSPAGADVSAETIFETTDGVDSAARVLMNPAALTALTAVGRQIVLRHEIAHVATIASTPIGTPAWLVEGFAEYVGNLGSGQSVALAASELRAQVQRGQVPVALPSEAAFASAHGGAVYEQAWLACRLVAARAGQAGLVRFYRLVGASLQPADAAVSSAVRSVLHESVAAFTTQWRTYLRTELR